VVHKPEEAFPKMVAALTKAQEWGDRIPMGVFYQNELVSTYQERLTQRIADYLTKPPAKQVISDAEGKCAAGLVKMLEELKVTG